MEYTNMFDQFKQLFSLDKEVINLEGQDSVFRLIPFTTNTTPIPLNRTGISNENNGIPYAAEDRNISENMQFIFPVYIPDSTAKYRKAIVLLHGLNERSWHKYLPWAYYLGQKTNRPVILFPLAFHMNRGAKDWSMPREMISLLTNRKTLQGVKMATIANIALSQRLSDDPLRFFTSGKQSADDLTQLLTNISEGHIPFLESGSQVDFFAYSIGAFLAQIFFLANPNNLVSNSKLFLFCGGAFFNEMQGTSRLIMDSYAFASLRRYYLHDFPIELETRSPFSSFVRGGSLGEAFLSMLAGESNKFYREYKLQQLSKQIRVLTLKQDAVIPSAAIQSTFASVKNRSKGMITELNFPFEHSHENPFPIFPNSNSTDVDIAFERVFTSASEFLN